MDPQVDAGWGSAAWVAERYRSELESLQAEGDALGVHVHTWRWLERERGWLAEFRDAEWIQHCLGTALDAFETSFGRPPESHRGGDGFADGAMMRQLAARGVSVDLTVEPGSPPGAAPGGEPTSGSTPDYRRVPASPYRSSPERYPARDTASAAGPIVVPLTSTAPSVRPLARRWVLTLESRSWVFAARLAVERALRHPEPLVFAVRSDVTLRPRWDAFVENLDGLATRTGPRFLTAAAAIGL
jgi:hypothetical protein